MISESNILDAVGFSKDARQEMLFIYDHLDWEEEEIHFQLLQEKINWYLIFIQNGQEELSDEQKRLLKKVKRIYINIRFKYQPPEAFQDFLRVSRQQIAKLKKVDIIYKVTG